LLVLFFCTAATVTPARRPERDELPYCAGMKLRYHVYRLSASHLLLCELLFTRCHELKRGQVRQNVDPPRYERLRDPLPTRSQLFAPRPAVSLIFFPFSSLFFLLKKLWHPRVTWPCQRTRSLSRLVSHSSIDVFFFFVQRGEVP